MTVEVVSHPIFDYPSAYDVAYPQDPFDADIYYISLDPDSKRVPTWQVSRTNRTPMPPSTPRVAVESTFTFTAPTTVIPAPLSTADFALVLTFKFAFFGSGVDYTESSVR